MWICIYSSYLYGEWLSFFSYFSYLIFFICASNMKNSCHIWCIHRATISTLLKIVGLFCKRALQKRLYSAKETYNFKEPTNRSPTYDRTTYEWYHLWVVSYLIEPLMGAVILNVITEPLMTKPLMSGTTYEWCQIWCHHRTTYDRTTYEWCCHIWCHHSGAILPLMRWGYD